MAIKGWVVHKVNRLFTRVDLPSRATPLGKAVMRPADDKREPELGIAGIHESLPRPQHLGAYAPLVAAIRDELEQFVASHVRMHLAIAEHDRYLLTSIEVECDAGDEERELLQRFMREFKPRQIKAYIAKEVIGRLPNASAIDLAHFGGLNVAGEDGGPGADEAYGELLAELRSSETQDARPPYQVSLKGRWSELDPQAAGAKDRSGRTPVLRTPLAGRSLDVDIEDAGGARHITLTSVVPGRRYVVGHGEGSDIIVNGKYASRRHCEIWLDKGAWWVTDSGSTNGVRVEAAGSVLGRSGANSGSAGTPTAIEVTTGARIILSGLARGEASQYPRLQLRATGELGAPTTPMAPRMPAPTTPATPIVASRSRLEGMRLTVHMASGERDVEIPAEPLPFRIGRSRSQEFVIDWVHEDVSGHHMDIVELDEAGAKVVVHGDNGVRIGGVTHAPGSQFHWLPGQTMQLGRTIGKERECTLTLSRRA